MSISSEITRIRNNVSSAFTAVRNMGGTVSATKSANLASAIQTIPTGARLNFSVIAYASNFPASASENTIGVITPSMKSWTMQVDEPSAPTEGLVWVKLGDASTTPVNLFEDISVFVYPLSASIYMNGAWTTLSAKCYQNGAWNGWAETLYEYGVVGSIADWTATGTSSSQHGFKEAASYPGLWARAYDGNTTNQVANYVYLTNMIDLSAYSTAKIRVRGGNVAWGTGNGGVTFMTSLTTTASRSGGPSNAITKVAITNVTDGLEYEMDISSLSGSYYVGVFLWVKDTSSTAVGYEIEFDRIVLE